jgi:uncharacterized protein involved in response to NO
MLHLTFIGGLSLLVFSVSAHVAMLHTGREQLASSAPPALWAVGGLTLAAAVVRMSAERLATWYFVGLGLAAALWLAAAITWVAFVLPMLLRPSRHA